MKTFSTQNSAIAASTCGTASASLKTHAIGSYAGLTTPLIIKSTLEK